MKLSLLAGIFALGALTSTDAMRFTKADSIQKAEVQDNDQSVAEAKVQTLKATALAEQFLASAEQSTFYTHEGSCTRAKKGDKISMKDGETGMHKVFTAAKCLGAGAFGEVWLAEDQKTNETVAFKVQTPTWMEERMVKEEEQSLIKVRTVSHGVVKMQAAGPCSWGADDATGRCMALELVTGGELTDLNQRLFKQNGGMPIEESLRLLKSLAEILAELHDGPANIVHNDLKAPNIMVEQKNGIDEPVIVDFGLAGYNGQDVGGGTLGYIPPEGARTGKSDVYALGMIFWGLVDKVQQDIAISKHCQNANLMSKMHECFRAETWREINTIVHPKVKELVKNMIATQASVRYEAKDVAAQVDTVLAEVKKDKNRVVMKGELEAAVSHRKQLMRALTDRIAMLEGVMIQVNAAYAQINAEKQARKLQNEKLQQEIDQLKKIPTPQNRMMIQQKEQQIRSNKQMDINVDAQLKQARFDLVLNLVPKQLDEKKGDKISLQEQIDKIEKEIPNAPGPSTRPFIDFSDVPLWVEVVAFIIVGVALLSYLVADKKKKPAARDVTQAAAAENNPGAAQPLKSAV